MRPVASNVIIPLSRLILTPSYADECSCSPSLAYHPPLARRDVMGEAAAGSDWQQARALRNVGVAMTVMGTVMTLVGAPLFYLSAPIDAPAKSYVGADLGLALLAMGQGGVVSGIPMWAAGGSKMNKAERRLLSLSASGARLTF